MKILVSSKGFSDLIKKIDLDTVVSVSIDDKKYFTINFGRMEALTIPVESKDKDSMVIQNRVRWDWLCRDLRGIQEQPVLIEFTDNVARFTLTF